MDIRPITEAYAVSPQIEPRDAPAIAGAGYETVICNRPDSEVPPELHADAIRRAVEAAGLRFAVVTVPQGGLDDARVAAQREAARGTRALAYCASGTRSCALWALGQAGDRPAEEILSTAARAGYDLGGLRGRIEAAEG